MGFITEIREFMREMRNELSLVKEVRSTLEGENKRLREENGRLLDRLMARDFEQLQVYTPPEKEEMWINPTDSNEDDLAGEIVDDYETE